MEVTALCFRLSLNMLLLLETLGYQHHALKHDAVYLRVFPDKQQFFEYEHISFICKEFNNSPKWKGVKSVQEFLPTCAGSTEMINCTIYTAFEADGGAYWCDSGQGERSNSINISVTDGPVILESPALPVTEGEAVKLRCREKASLSNRTAHFYKDGLQIDTSYSGHMTIHNVSKSNEGLYKCSIAGAGESPVSWLIVKYNSWKKQEEAGAVMLETPGFPVMEGAAASLHCRMKSSPPEVPAVFFKDGAFIGTSSSGHMFIHRVYKSHEGLYKCNISGAGASPGRWLTVQSLRTATPQTDADCPCSGLFFYYLLVVRTFSTVVMVVLLLLLLGLLHCRRLK